MPNTATPDSTELEALIAFFQLLDQWERRVHESETV